MFTRRLHLRFWPSVEIIFWVGRILADAAFPAVLVPQPPFALLGRIEGNAPLLRPLRLVSPPAVVQSDDSQLPAASSIADHDVAVALVIPANRSALVIRWTGVLRRIAKLERMVSLPVWLR